MISSDQMNSSFEFYETVPVFSEFRNVTSPKHFRAVPDDWVLVIAEVKNSSVHVENGRYKDINLVSASAIIAVINAVGRKSFPYIFSGDGATMLVPMSALDVAKPALNATQAMAAEDFDFEVEIGLVPVRDLRIAGADLTVARHEISKTSILAAFRGSALSLAHKWMKEGPKYLLPARPRGSVKPAADLFAGLQCRWHPLQARYGAVMSVLVRSLKGDDVYVEVLEFVNKLIGDGNPASPKQMRMHWPLFHGFTEEAKVQTWSLGWLARFKYFVYLLAFIPLLKLANQLNFNLGRGFSMRRYVGELVENTDYRRFDDILRMVVDVTHAQGRQILAELEKRKAAGDLVYGHHASNSAHMTCLVFTPDEHIHFVDGAHGGYALARSGLNAL